MKKIFAIAAVLMVTMFACKKENFDYQLYKPSVDEIDSVYLSAGATSLIAEGHAALQFVAEAYRKIEITKEDGTKKDSLVFVDYKNLPAGSLKIYRSDNSEVGMTYSTISAASGTESFYAQLGNLKSKTQTVTLRNKQVLPEKWYVDVVFHVFELNPNDPKYDQLTYQEVSQPLLVQAIEDVNKVFNNKLGNDPNGGSANIEFRLAEENPAGNTIINPGYNKIIYDKSWMTYTWGFSADDFWNKINATPSYTWDPKRYLNIYIIPTGASESMGDSDPKYQIVEDGSNPIEGIPNIINNASELPSNQNYQIYGVGVPRTLLFPGTGRRIELSPYLGRYYGLMRTAVSSPTVTDYVSDTRKYIGTDQLQSIIKVGIDGIKFMANNAMDDNRYPSLRNSFTLEQVNRMRAVMEHSPNRWHWKQ